MSLVYRAIWQDDRADLIDATSATFERWAREKHNTDLVFDKQPTTVGDVTTSLFAVEADGVRGAIAEIVEDSPTVRWMVRQRVLVSDAGESWVWVDVERVTSEVFQRQDIAAPRLVRELLAEGIASGGNPRIGNVLLRPTANAILQPFVEAGVIQRILDPQRIAPIVVYTHDPRVEIPETMNRANTTQTILAGIAEVVVLTPPAEATFVEELGYDLAVWGGAVRLYLPGSMDPWRHRYFLNDVVERHPREVGRRIARALSGSIAARRAPAPYEAIRGLLRSRGGKSSDELLALADQEIAERDAQIEELRTELQQRDDLLFDRAVDIDDLEDQLAAANRLSTYWRHLALSDETEVDTEVTLPEAASSLTEAARLCQSHLDTVVLPDAALRDLDELDSAPEASGWSKASWRAFKALAAYAKEASSTNGGFWEWCRNSDHPDTWPATPKKLSMSESETVMKNRTLRAARMLPVSIDVSPTGEIEMQSHFKVAEGGGHDIPRIYFFDDTKGPTGKVHVGFFGPHRYMSNTKT